MANGSAGRPLIHPAGSICIESGAPVERSSHRGSRRREILTLHAGGATVRATVAATLRIEDTVRWLNDDKVVLFDPASGLNLAVEP